MRLSHAVSQSYIDMTAPAELDIFVCVLANTNLAWGTEPLVCGIHGGRGATEQSSGMVIENLQLLNLQAYIHSSATNHTFMGGDGKETDNWVSDELEVLGEEMELLEEQGC